MTTSSPPTRTFLSYARGDDEKFVRWLCADLAAAVVTPILRLTLSITTINLNLHSLSQC